MDNQSILSHYLNSNNKTEDLISRAIQERNEELALQNQIKQAKANGTYVDNVLAEQKLNNEFINLANNPDLFRNYSEGQLRELYLNEAKKRGLLISENELGNLFDNNIMPAIREANNPSLDSSNVSWEKTFQPWYSRLADTVGEGIHAVKEEMLHNNEDLVRQKTFNFSNEDKAKYDLIQQKFTQKRAIEDQISTLQAALSKEKDPLAVAHLSSRIGALNSKLDSVLTPDEQAFMTNGAGAELSKIDAEIATNNIIRTNDSNRLSLDSWVQTAIEQPEYKEFLDITGVKPGFVRSAKVFGEAIRSAIMDHPFETFNSVAQTLIPSMISGIIAAASPSKKAKTLITGLDYTYQFLLEQNSNFNDAYEARMNQLKAQGKFTMSKEDFYDMTLSSVLASSIAAFGELAVAKGAGAFKPFITKANKLKAKQQEEIAKLVELYGLDPENPIIKGAIVNGNRETIEFLRDNFNETLARNINALPVNTHGNGIRGMVGNTIESTSNTIKSALNKTIGTTMPITARGTIGDAIGKTMVGRTAKTANKYLDRVGLGPKDILKAGASEALAEGTADVFRQRAEGAKETDWERVATQAGAEAAGGGAGHVAMRGASVGYVGAQKVAEYYRNKYNPEANYQSNEQHGNVLNEIDRKIDNNEFTVEDISNVEATIKENEGHIQEEQEVKNDYVAEFSKFAEKAGFSVDTTLLNADGTIPETAIQGRTLTAKESKELQRINNNIRARDKIVETFKTRNNQLQERIDSSYKKAVEKAYNESTGFKAMTEETKNHVVNALSKLSASERNELIKQHEGFVDDTAAETYYKDLVEANKKIQSGKAEAEEDYLKLAKRTPTAEDTALIKRLKELKILSPDIREVFLDDNLVRQLLDPSVPLNTVETSIENLDAHGVEKSRKARLKNLLTRDFIKTLRKQKFNDNTRIGNLGNSELQNKYNTEFDSKVNQVGRITNNLVNTWIRDVSYNEAVDNDTGAIAGIEADLGSNLTQDELTYVKDLLVHKKEVNAKIGAIYNKTRNKITTDKRQELQDIIDNIPNGNSQYEIGGFEGNYYIQSKAIKAKEVLDKIYTKMRNELINSSNKKQTTQLIANLLADKIEKNQAEFDEVFNSISDKKLRAAALKLKDVMMINLKDKQNNSDRNAAGINAYRRLTEILRAEAINTNAEFIKGINEQDSNMLKLAGYVHNYNSNPIQDVARKSSIEEIQRANANKKPSKKEIRENEFNTITQADGHQMNLNSYKIMTKIQAALNDILPQYVRQELQDLFNGNRTNGTSDDFRRALMDALQNSRVSQRTLDLLQAMVTRYDEMVNTESYNRNQRSDHEAIKNLYGLLVNYSNPTQEINGADIIDIELEDTTNVNEGADFIQNAPNRRKYSQNFNNMIHLLEDAGTINRDHIENSVANYFDNNLVIDTSMDALSNDILRDMVDSNDETETHYRNNFNDNVYRNNIYDSIINPITNAGPVLNGVIGSFEQDALGGLSANAKSLWNTLKNGTEAQRRQSFINADFNTAVEVINALFNHNLTGAILGTKSFTNERNDGQLVVSDGQGEFTIGTRDPNQNNRMIWSNIQRAQDYLANNINNLGIRQNEISQDLGYVLDRLDSIAQLLSNSNDQRINSNMLNRVINFANISSDPSTQQKIAFLYTFNKLPNLSAINKGGHNVIRRDRRFAQALLDAIENADYVNFNHRYNGINGVALYQAIIGTNRRNTMESINNVRQELEGYVGIDDIPSINNISGLIYAVKLQQAIRDANISTGNAYTLDYLQTAATMHTNEAMLEAFAWRSIEVPNYNQHRHVNTTVENGVASAENIVKLARTLLQDNVWGNHFVNRHILDNTIRQGNQVHQNLIQSLYTEPNLDQFNGFNDQVVLTNIYDALADFINHNRIHNYFGAHNNVNANGIPSILDDQRNNIAIGQATHIINNIINQSDLRNNIEARHSSCIGINNNIFNNITYGADLFNINQADNVTEIGQMLLQIKNAIMFSFKPSGDEFDGLFGETINGKYILREPIANALAIYALGYITQLNGENSEDYISTLSKAGIGAGALDFFSRNKCKDLQTLGTNLGQGLIRDLGLVPTDNCSYNTRNKLVAALGARALGTFIASGLVEYSFLNKETGAKSSTIGKGDMNKTIRIIQLTNKGEEFYQRVERYNIVTNGNGTNRRITDLLRNDHDNETAQTDDEYTAEQQALDARFNDGNDPIVDQDFASYPNQGIGLLQAKNGIYRILVDNANGVDQWYYLERRYLFKDHNTTVVDCQSLLVDARLHMAGEVCNNVIFDSIRATINHMLQNSDNFATLWQTTSYANMLKGIDSIPDDIKELFGFFDTKYRFGSDKIRRQTENTKIFIWLRDFMNRGGNLRNNNQPIRFHNRYLTSINNRLFVQGTDINPREFKIFRQLFNVPELGVNTNNNNTDYNVPGPLEEYEANQLMDVISVSLLEHLGFKFDKMDAIEWHRLFQRLCEEREFRDLLDVCDPTQHPNAVIDINYAYVVVNRLNRRLRQLADTDRAISYNISQANAGDNRSTKTNTVTKVEFNAATFAALTKFNQWKANNGFNGNNRHPNDYAQFLRTRSLNQPIDLHGLPTAEFDGLNNGPAFGIVSTGALGNQFISSRIRQKLMAAGVIINRGGTDYRDFSTSVMNQDDDAIQKLKDTYGLNIEEALEKMVHDIQFNSTNILGDVSDAGRRFEQKQLQDILRLASILVDPSLAENLSDDRAWANDIQIALSTNKAFVRDIAKVVVMLIGYSSGEAGVLETATIALQQGAKLDSDTGFPRLIRSVLDSSNNNAEANTKLKALLDIMARTNNGVVHFTYDNRTVTYSNGKFDGKQSSLELIVGHGSNKQASTKMESFEITFAKNPTMAENIKDVLLKPIIKCAQKYVEPVTERLNKENEAIEAMADAYNAVLSASVADLIDRHGGDVNAITQAEIDHIVEDLLVQFEIGNGNNVAFLRPFKEQAIKIIDGALTQFARVTGNPKISVKVEPDTVDALQAALGPLTTHTRDARVVYQLMRNDFIRTIHDAFLANAAQMYGNNNPGVNANQAFIEQTVLAYRQDMQISQMCTQIANKIKQMTTANNNNAISFNGRDVPSIIVKLEQESENLALLSMAEIHTQEQALMNLEIGLNSGEPIYINQYSAGVYSAFQPDTAWINNMRQTLREDLTRCNNHKTIIIDNHRVPLEVADYLVWIRDTFNSGNGHFADLANLMPHDPKGHINYTHLMNCHTREEIHTYFLGLGAHNMSIDDHNRLYRAFTKYYNNKFTDIADLVATNVQPDVIRSRYNSIVHTGWSLRTSSPREAFTSIYNNFVNACGVLALAESQENKNIIGNLEIANLVYSSNRNAVNQLIALYTMTGRTFNNEQRQAFNMFSRNHNYIFESIRCNRIDCTRDTTIIKSTDFDYARELENLRLQAINEFNGDQQAIDDRYKELINNFFDKFITNSEFVKNITGSYATGNIVLTMESTFDILLAGVLSNLLPNANIVLLPNIAKGADKEALFLERVLRQNPRHKTKVVPILVEGANKEGTTRMMNYMTNGAFTSDYINYNIKDMTKGLRQTSKGGKSLSQRITEEQIEGILDDSFNIIRFDKHGDLRTDLNNSILNQGDLSSDDFAWFGNDDNINYSSLLNRANNMNKDAGILTILDEEVKDFYDYAKLGLNPENPEYEIEECHDLEQIFSNTRHFIIPVTSSFSTNNLDSVTDEGIRALLKRDSNIVKAAKIAQQRMQELVRNFNTKDTLERYRPITIKDVVVGNKRIDLTFATHVVNTVSAKEILSEVTAIQFKNKNEFTYSASSKLRSRLKNEPRINEFLKNAYRKANANPESTIVIPDEVLNEQYYNTNLAKLISLYTHMTECHTKILGRKINIGRLTNAYNETASYVDFNIDEFGERAKVIMDNYKTQTDQMFRNSTVRSGQRHHYNEDNATDERVINLNLYNKIDDIGSVIQAALNRDARVGIDNNYLTNIIKGIKSAHMNINLRIRNDIRMNGNQQLVKQGRIHSNFIEVGRPVNGKATEVLVHELVHAVLEHLKEDASAYHVAQQLFTYAHKNLRAEHFDDITEGKTILNYIFNDKTYDQLGEFLAYALTNKSMQDALSRLGNTGSALQDTSRGVFNRLVSTIVGDLNIDTNKPINNAIYSIFMASTRRAHKYWQEANDTTLKVSDRSVLDNAIINKLKVSQDLQDIIAITDVTKTSDVHEVITDIMNENATNKDSFYKELVENLDATSSSKWKLASMRSKIKHQVDGTRERASSAINAEVKNLISKFSNKLERNMARYFIRADIQSLMDGNTTTDELVELLTNKTARDNAITNELRAIKLFDNANFNYYVNATKGLKDYMIHGVNTSGIGYKNAYEVANMSGSEWHSRALTKSTNFVQHIDKLATLYAIEELNQENSEIYTELVSHREELSKLIDLQKGIMNREYNTVYKDSMQKNHVPKTDAYKTTKQMHTAKIIPASELQAYRDYGYGIVQKVDFDPMTRVAIETNEDYYLVQAKFQLDPGYVAGIGAMTDVNKGRATRDISVDGTKRVDLDVDDHRKRELVEVRKALSNRIRYLNQANARLLPTNTVGTLTPTYDELDQIVGAKYEINTDLKNSLEGSKPSFQYLLGDVMGSIVERTNAPQLNEEFAKLLDEMYDSGKYDFVWINDTDENVDIRDAYDHLPFEVKQYFKEKYDDKGVPVARSYYNTIVGTDKLTFTKPDLTIEEKRNKAGLVNEAIRTAMHSLSAIGLNKISGKAETIARILTKMGKENIVIKGINTSVANIMSNCVTLYLNGLSINDTFKYQLEALNYFNKYSDYLARLDSLNTLELSRKLTYAETLERQTIQHAIKQLPIADLIDKGLLPQIAEDLGNQEYWLKDWIHSYIPKEVEGIVHTAFIDQSTAIFKALNKLATLGDYTGKYALWKHLTKTSLASSDSAIRKANQLFIDYNNPLPKSLQYLDDIGAINFLKYWTGNMSNIVNQLAYKPSKSLAIIATNSLLLDGRMPNNFSSIAGLDAIVSKFNVPGIGLYLDSWSGLPIGRLHDLID